MKHALFRLDGEKIMFFLLVAHEQRMLQSTASAEHEKILVLFLEMLNGVRMAA